MTAQNRYSKAFAMQPMVNQAGIRPPQINMRDPPSKFESQYKGKLTPLQFKVAYEDQLEIPVVNQFADLSSDDKGLYKSVASGEVLFSSKDKFTYPPRAQHCSFTKSVNEDKLLKTVDTGEFPKTLVMCATDEVNLGYHRDFGPNGRYEIFAASLEFTPFASLSKDE